MHLQVLASKIGVGPLRKLQLMMVQMYREARLKWMNRNQPTIGAQLSSQMAQL